MALDKRKISSFFDSEQARERLNAFLKTGNCYPLHVVLHLTTSCNHQCNFCSNSYNINGSEKHHTLDAQDVIDYVREFKEIGVKNLVISGGGEPLLHKDISAILISINNSRLPSSLYSNLDIDLSAGLAKQLSLLNSVGVNINTLEPSIYKATRGNKSNLERVTSNIKTLQALNASLNALVIVRDDTAIALENTVTGLAEMGLKGVTVSSAFEFQYPDKVQVGKKTFEAMERLKSRDLFGVRVLSPVETSIKLNGKTFCGSYYFDITIGADYWAYPCCMTAYMEAYKLFNLSGYASFKQAWQSKERKRAIDKFQPSCETCWFTPLNKTLVETIKNG